MRQPVGQHTIQAVTREERLHYCRICNNRTLNLQRGLLCSLTNEPATFEHTFPDFSEDLDEKRELKISSNATIKAMADLATLLFNVSV